MGSIFSVGSGSGQDFYSMFFNTGSGSSSKSKSNAASGIFGNNSTIIGDMSMIKSGTYKKLLNSYYSATGTTNSSKRASLNGSSVSSTISKASDDSIADIKKAGVDAESLMKSAESLSKKSLYKTKKDDKGNDVYDMEAIGKAVKGFVESYNSYIDAAGKLDSTTMLNQALGVVKSTAKNARLLSDIGITIGTDNKLKLDENKLKEAKATTVNSLFAGNGSYGSYVQSKASATYRSANSAVYSNTHGGISYGYNGSYSLLGTSGTNSLDKYL